MSQTFAYTMRVEPQSGGVYYRSGEMAAASADAVRERIDLIARGNRWTVYDLNVKVAK